MAKTPTRNGATKTKAPKKVEALTHESARRTNIPTAEHQSLSQRLEEMNRQRLCAIRVRIRCRPVSCVNATKIWTHRSSGTARASG